jgi:hypothetical protein
VTSLSISVFLLIASFFPQQQASSSAPSPVFRDPFTLKLRVDKEHYYEQHFDKVPYVVENEVYLFAGETFGIKIEIKNDQISGIAYEPDVTKADVWFIFSQEKDLQGGKGMMLTIQNKTKHTLLLDALMTVPQSTAIQNTSIVPIAAGLSDYEGWPHPIVQLVLRNPRFAEKPEKPNH